MHSRLAQVEGVVVHRNKYPGSDRIAKVIAVTVQDQYIFGFYLFSFYRRNAVAGEERVNQDYAIRRFDQPARVSVQVSLIALVTLLRKFARL